jgi:hypothetical protein
MPPNPSSAFTALFRARARTSRSPHRNHPQGRYTQPWPKSVRIFLDVQSCMFKVCSCLWFSSLHGLYRASPDFTQFCCLTKFFTEIIGLQAEAARLISELITPVKLPQPHLKFNHTIKMQQIMSDNPNTSRINPKKPDN